MTKSDHEDVVTLLAFQLEETEFDDYANTSDEEIDDLAVNEAINDDDSPTLTASCESDSSDTGRSADASLSFYLHVFKRPTIIARYKG